MTATTFRFGTFATIVLLFVAASAANADIIDTNTIVPPYPHSATVTKLFVVHQSRLTNDGETLALLSLSGLVAQRQASIYLIPTERAEPYETWTKDFSTRLHITIDTSYDTPTALSSLLSLYKSQVRGYYLCNLADTSMHNALSLAGVNGAIVTTPAAEPLIKSLGLTLLGDTRGTDPFSVFMSIKGQLSTRIVVFQDPAKWLYLSCYTVYARAFILYNMTSPVADALFAHHLQPQAALFGWGGEQDLVHFASRNSVVVHACDWATNMPVFTNLPVTAAGTPVLPSSTVATLSNEPMVAPTKENVHTVSFLVTDGDNIQWLVDSFVEWDKWWASPSRGKVPVGWTITPALADIAPSLLSLIKSQQLPNDDIVVAPSGHGYIYPTIYPALDDFVAQTAQYSKAAGWRIVNIIDDYGKMNTNQSASPNDWSIVDRYTIRPEVDAVFYYMYSDYSLLKGNMSFSNGKPVVAGRYNLWEEYNTPAQLAARLNAMPRDSTSKDGYSLIPVHVWSMKYDDIVATINLLDKQGVRVLSPTAFVKQIAASVPH